VCFVELFFCVATLVIYLCLVVLRLISQSFGALRLDNLRIFSASRLRGYILEVFVFALLFPAKFSGKNNAKPNYYSKF